MDIPETTGQYGVPEQPGPYGGTPYGAPGDSLPGDGALPGGGWPANELEEVLAASLGNPGAGPRLVEVLGRSPVWIPLPNGGGPDQGPLDLPTLELDGQAYVPVFSSEQQFRTCVGSHLDFAVAPAVEFARGLPPQLGIAVNPDGAVGMPLPPPAVAELCRTGRTPLDGPSTGGRVRLFEPDWQDEPVDFLAAAAGEFQQSGVVVTARRALASVEGDPPALFVGVQLSSWEGADRNAPMDALGRALGREAVPWPVHLLLLDMAQDPVADWMLERIRPFYTREH
ncbi:enhanced serine sensitivity protein SseB [Streptomyces spiroverticillatus]|uniref:Enhanced serine sensitivity protein SseB n=1 Tax=Streptomyces finlayi TaxID=67296 RepID=A0A919CCS1_9ACTN|nr:enhanced serine sensitivity protein SseB [Streptomyces spiroverticillatus]GHD06095.1 enhanced serine sensitivity protein SseB [Streptomyces finlayi]